jgi:hypothetical protein
MDLRTAKLTNEDFYPLKIFICFGALFCLVFSKVLRLSASSALGGGDVFFSHLSLKAGFLDDHH